MKSIETNVERVIVGKVLPDEDLFDAIIEMVNKHDIKSGLINVIGALNKFTIGFFDLKSKEYKFKTFEEDVELISGMGNISYKNGAPLIHIHAAIGRDDLSIIGGHLTQPTIISVTGEVYIYGIGKKLNRIEDTQFGLSLLAI